MNDILLFEEEVFKDLGYDVEVEIILIDSDGKFVDFLDEDVLDKVIEFVLYGGCCVRKIVLLDGEVVIFYEVRLLISGFYKIKLMDLGGYYKYYEIIFCNILWKIY